MVNNISIIRSSVKIKLKKKEEKNIYYVKYCNTESTNFASKNRSTLITGFVRNYVKLKC